MMILDPIYRYGNATAWEKDAQARRANPEEARTLSRLADAAIETAKDFDVPCDRREALVRARENLNWARMAIAKGVEW